MFVSDIAIFVLKRDVKLQPTNLLLYAAVLHGCTFAYLVKLLQGCDVSYQTQSDGLYIVACWRF